MDYKTKRHIFDEIRAFNREIEKILAFNGIFDGEIPKNLPKEAKEAFQEMLEVYKSNQQYLEDLMPRVWGGSLYLNKGMGGVRIR